MDGGACADYVNCRFCGKQFLRRHQKLLMLHIEQRHVDDLRSLLDIRGAIQCCREDISQFLSQYFTE